MSSRLLVLQTYDPVLAWAHRHFGAKFIASNSIFGADQPPDTRKAVANYLEGENVSFGTDSFDVWR